MTHLREIGLAMQMYANDHGGALPPDLMTVMVSADLPTDAYVCPSSNDRPARGSTALAMLQQFTAPGHCSYLLARPLPATWNALTPSHVLVIERAALHADGDGTAGMNALFGDGTVRRVSAAEAVRITAELFDGHNPPRPAP